MTWAMLDKEISLFGFKTASVTVSRHPMVATMYGGYRPIYRIKASAPYDFEAEFALPVRQSRELSNSFERLARQGEFTISRLGDTQICECCNAQMRPGRMTCHRCGAPYTATVKDSKYDRVGRALFRNYSMQAFDWYSSDCVNISIEFSMYDVLFRADDPRRTFGGWCTTHIEDGWICWYCKSVNKLETTECHYCGGGRLPFSDLARIATHCLYCGRKLQSGAVCDGCGSAQNGYSVWPPRYDW